MPKNLEVLPGGNTENATVCVSMIRSALHAHANAEDAVQLRRFFKTGPGEYGEGDRFIGVRVPLIRQVAKQYRDISLETVQALLFSPLHEERLLALLLLVQKYQRGDEKLQKEVFRIYLAHTQCINNWDLVDLSAEHIVGAHLYVRPRSLLYQLADSESLWERRIAIIATFYFIRRDDFTDTLQIAALLLQDKEDLLHKAVGWMLREVGKRDREREESFLKCHVHTMPRTMLRYAIEKFPESLRQSYLKGTVKA